MTFVGVFGLRKLAFGTALAMTVIGSGTAYANVVLLNLVDTDGLTHYDLGFTAANSTTTLNVGGYNVPAAINITNNTVFGSGRAINLLGPSWSFTPAASGSGATPFSDFSGVDALAFGGVTPGSYDTFSQTFATTAGQAYTYSFDYYNPASPSGFQVSIDAGTAAGGSGPGAPAPLIGLGWLSALAAAMALVLTRALPLRRKPAIA